MQTKCTYSRCLIAHLCFQQKNTCDFSLSNDADCQTVNSCGKNLAELSLLIIKQKKLSGKCKKPFQSSHGRHRHLRGKSRQCHLRAFVSLTCCQVVYLKTLKSFDHSSYNALNNFRFHPCFILCIGIQPQWQSPDSQSICTW